jgi:hypothetical protein
VFNVVSSCHAAGVPSVSDFVADELAREGSAHHFAGPEPASGVSRQSIRRKIQCWLDRHHLMRWQGLAGTLRVDLGPSSCCQDHANVL